MIEFTPNDDRWFPERRKQFDQWLAGVKADAWDEGNEHGYNYRVGEEAGSLNEEDRHGNPYREEKP